jgi:RHS repeat-associated protein
MVKAYNGAVLVSEYVYDADGKRVRRIIGGQETWQVYGMGGELLAEYAAGAAPGAAQKEYGYRNGQLLVVWDGSEAVGQQLQWLVQDHLGSTRMVVDRSGSLGGVRRHDYLPFGEQLGSGVGIRSASIGYGGDSVRQKFTGKERDDEIGLDYFLARYHSSVQGRFTSVDPENAGADPALPQTWNGYSYAINNPITYSDPDGQKVKICDANGNCSEISDNDARKYFYNKEYQNQSGYRIDGKGGIYDTGGNRIGSYERTSADDMSGFANALFFGRGGLIERAPQMKATIGLTIGAGVGGGITGGVGLVVAGGGAGVITLGLQGARVAGTVATGTAAFLNQMGRTDARIFQQAINNGMSAANTFADNVAKLVQTVRAVVPNGQINKIGEIGGSPIYGSLRSGVGIAQVDGVQVVVKVVQGTPQIIGKLE